MSILGIILLVVILAMYSVILLASQINYAITNSSNTNTHTIFTKILNITDMAQQENFKRYAGSLALLLGIWNLFGPNFGSIYGGLTIVGALIPSIVLLIDAFILNPYLFEWIPKHPFSEQFHEFIEKINPIAGWITLIVTILHSIFYRLPFF